MRGNPFIPHWPLPSQQLFLGLHQQADDTERVFEALYGGAAGGGKSDALLMAAAQYAWKHPEFAGICFRRTFADLSQPGALLDRALEWWLPAGVQWIGSKGYFQFPNGAKVAFAFLFRPNDHLKYQGAEYQFTAWDELTQWPDQRPYEYVGLSRVRRLAGSSVPLRTLSASNPGGPGHNWVMRKFVGGVNPETGEREKPRHFYVPARIQDNPYLDQEAYIKGLMDLHPTVRAQLLNGDWSARDPGDYFRAEWFGPLVSPEDLWPPGDCLRVRWWDLAASEKESAARTAGVRMAQHRSGVRMIEHAKAFRATPGKRDDLIVQVAQQDGPTVVQGIEIEGGSGGLAQFYALEERLKRVVGCRVAGARPSPMLSDKEKKWHLRNSPNVNAKAQRAGPVASCLERGYQRRGECPDTGSPWWGEDEGKPLANQRDGIRLVAGKWTQDYLDEVEAFPDIDLMDYADATSGAWAYLEAHGFGQRPSSRVAREPEATRDWLELHPSEREAIERRHKRIWTP